MLENPNVAIAMSVYIEDDLFFLKAAINSLLNQTYKNITIFIAIDGQLKTEVQDYLNELNKQGKVLLLFNDKNKGLATRLNQLIDSIMESNRFDFIARMDADDVCMKNRIAVQVNFLQNQQDISVVGSDVMEIDESGNKLFYKRMESDHSTIITKLIKKCPFNHPTVMFRSNIFEMGSNRYKEELLNTQDYYLWVDLLCQNFKFANINEPLLHFRINNSFHQRRGMKKAMNDFKARVYAMRKLNIFSFVNVSISCLLFALRISPRAFKKLAYKHLRD